MRVNLSLGSWLYQFNEDKLNETHLPQILDCYTKAMEYNHPPDYKAWKVPFVTTPPYAISHILGMGAN